jgi:membrane-associated phospholipid phosphatase
VTTASTVSAPATLLARLDVLDRRLSRRLLYRPEGRTGRALLVALRRASQTGSYGTGWIALFAVGATVLEGWRIAVIAAACVVGMLLLNTAIKVLVRRPRPVARAIEHQPRTFSMPSAHTSMAMVGAAAMSQVAPELAIAWWGWAVVLAVSRIMLGMHFFGDVVMGALLGAMVASAVVEPLLLSQLG